LSTFLHPYQLTYGPLLEHSTVPGSQTEPLIDYYIHIHKLPVFKECVLWDLKRIVTIFIRKFLAGFDLVSGPKYCQVYWFWLHLVLNEIAHRFKKIQNPLYYDRYHTPVTSFSTKLRNNTRTNTKIPSSFPVSALHIDHTKPNKPRMARRLLLQFIHEFTLDWVGSGLCRSCGIIKYDILLFFLAKRSDEA